MVWDTLDQFCLDPTEWGWQINDRVFTPIQTTIDCAPAELLKFVRCKCKSGCSSGNCSFKRHGLPCVPACKNCRGDCENSEYELMNDVDEEHEEEVDNIFDILSNI